MHWRRGFMKQTSERQILLKTLNLFGSSILVGILGLSASSVEAGETVLARCQIINSKSGHFSDLSAADLYIKKITNRRANGNTRIEYRVSGLITSPVREDDGTYTQRDNLYTVWGDDQPKSEDHAEDRGSEVVINMVGPSPDEDRYIAVFDKVRERLVLQERSSADGAQSGLGLLRHLVNLFTGAQGKIVAEMELGCLKVSLD